MSKIRSLCLITLFTVAVLCANTARNYGIGFGFVASPNTGSAVFVNPAGVSETGNHYFFAGYSRLFVGVTDDLYHTIVSYSLPRLYGFGLGAGYYQFGSAAFSNIDANIALNYRIGFSRSSHLSLGVSPHLHKIAYSNYDPSDPLFARYGDSKVSMGLNAGLIFQYRNFTLGTNIENIIRPNVALDDTVESGKLGQGYTFGISYEIARYGLKPFLGFRYEEDDPDGKLHPSFGLEAVFLDGLISLRSSLSDNDFNASIGINPIVGKRPLEFDYCFTNPTGDLGSANLVSHHFGIGYSLPQREKPIVLPDLSLKPARQYNRIHDVEKPITIDMLFMRDNVAVKDSILVMLEVEGPQSRVFKSKILLSQQKSVEIPFEFKLDEIGEYRLNFSIDPNNQIKEKDLTNNHYRTNITVSGDLFANLLPEHNTLEIEHLTFISEEEPFVPIIFFDANSDEILPRYRVTLDVLANRLRNNPDIELELLGYAERNTDTSLSVAAVRATKVKAYLVERGVPGNSIKIKPADQYDVTMPRIEARSPGLSEQETRWIYEENRRVELVPSLRGEQELIESWELAAYTDGIAGFVRSNSSLISANPDLTLQFEWTAPEGVVERYRDISSFRDLIQNMIEGECGRQYIIPIIVKSGDEEKVGLSISSEKIIYAPIQHAQTAIDFNIPRDKRNNNISVEVSNRDVIVFHNLVVIDAIQGDTLRRLSTGAGAPPEEVNWDWRDDNAVLLDPTGRYQIHLTAKDVLDNEFAFYSDTIKIIPTESMQRNTSSIIIQFVFDETASISHFLESRIDHFAQWVRKIGESEYTERANIRVLGHTDPIGSPERNAELSRLRAEKEYHSLISHLGAILGIADKENVQQWLLDKGINLSYEGVSDSYPYTISRPEGIGRFRETLLGDNEFPEGRTINRRVVIEVEEIFKGGVEAPAATVPLK